jgi:hypothetical protein
MNCNVFYLQTQFVPHRKHPLLGHKNQSVTVYREKKPLFVLISIQKHINPLFWQDAGFWNCKPGGKQSNGAALKD